MEKQYDKLVRDNIPTIIEDQGNIPVFRILSDTAYATYLNKKLKEEVEEYLKDNCVEELCDIFEVIKAIYTAMGFTDAEFEKVREAKVLKNGAFKDKILLEKIIVSEHPSV
ncbi:MAG: phosphoribosyl-ATP pyrophosphohydrolase [Caproiciproducens sp.]|nr:phosphoribosyl-ATP pyrophosphohydrolase [Caproiciproducens sp.]